MAPTTALDRRRERARLRPARRPDSGHAPLRCSSPAMAHGPTARVPPRTAMLPATATRIDSLSPMLSPATARASRTQPQPTARAPTRGRRGGTFGCGRRPAKAWRVGTRAAERAGNQAAPTAARVPMSRMGTTSLVRVTGPPTGRSVRLSSHSSGIRRVRATPRPTPRRAPSAPPMTPWARRNQRTVRGEPPVADRRPMVRSWRRAPTANAAAITVPSTRRATAPPR